MSIRDLFGLKSRKGHEYKYPVNNNLPVIKSDRLIGIEVEVENYAIKRSEYSSVWRRETDGSLRNNGIEYTTEPIRAALAPYALHELLGECLDEACCFSPRTSIHVHMNMLEDDDQAVTAMTMLYMALEPLFFQFTGRGRIKNIYCVPVMDTNLMSGAVYKTLRQLREGWSKYTAWNLLPLAEYGTVEARHMHGTFDINKVCTWIRLLTKLADFCTQTPPQEVMEVVKNLGENTDYQLLLARIFDEDAAALKYQCYDNISKSVDRVADCFADPNSVRELSLSRDTKTPFYLSFA